MLISRHKNKITKIEEYFNKDFSYLTIRQKIEFLRTEFCDSKLSDYFLARIEAEQKNKLPYIYALLLLPFESYKNKMDLFIKVIDLNSLYFLYNKNPIILNKILIEYIKYCFYSLSNLNFLLKELHFSKEINSVYDCHMPKSVKQFFKDVVYKECQNDFCNTYNYYANNMNECPSYSFLLKLLACIEPINYKQIYNSTLNAIAYPGSDSFDKDYYLNMISKKYVSRIDNVDQFITQVINDYNNRDISYKDNLYILESFRDYIFSSRYILQIDVKHIVLILLDSHIDKSIEFIKIFEEYGLVNEEIEKSFVKKAIDKIYGFQKMDCLINSYSYSWFLNKIILNPQIYTDEINKLLHFLQSTYTDFIYKQNYVPKYENNSDKFFQDFGYNMIVNITKYFAEIYDYNEHVASYIQSILRVTENMILVHVIANHFKSIDPHIESTISERIKEYLKQNDSKLYPHIAEFIPFLNLEKNEDLIHHLSLINYPLFKDKINQCLIKSLQL